MHLNCHTSEYNMEEGDDSTEDTSETDGNDANTTKRIIVIWRKRIEIPLLE